MKLTIERNIPIPPKDTGRRTSPALDVVRQMKVGDSIAAPTLKDANRVYQCLMRLGRERTIRKFPNGTYRVWRTA